MQFILTGFTQDLGFRVFAFDGVAEDRSRTPFTVRTDLALLKRYDIRIQELPLLCRGLLEHREDSDLERTMTFTEAGMRVHADHCAEERRVALAKRKPARRTPTDPSKSTFNSPLAGGPAQS